MNHSSTSLHLWVSGDYHPDEPLKVSQVCPRPSVSNSQMTRNFGQNKTGHSHIKLKAMNWASFFRFRSVGQSM